jgi:uncharacterized protein (TIGR00251 family)
VKAAAGRLPVRVQPRASRSAVVGWRQGVLHLRVTAPPVEGEANRAVGALVAEVLGVRPSAVAVVRGERGRDKLVQVQGLTGPQIEARLRSRMGGAQG